MRLPAAVVLLFCAASSGRAASLLSEDEATTKAVTYLRGDIYGTSRMDVINAIRETHLMTKGSGICGPLSAPVWAFHVHTKYDGWLYLDAVTGEKVCSSLPFFR